MGTVLDSIIDALLYIPRVLFEWIMGLIAWAIENLPGQEIMSELLDNVSDGLNQIPSEVSYILHIFQFEYGITVCFTALVVRFLIKLIPFVG